MKYIGHYDIDTDGRQTRSLSPAARNKMAYVVETIAGLEPVEIISPSVVTGAISDGGRVEKLSDKVSLRLFPSLGRKNAVLGKLSTLLTTLCFEFYLLTHIHRGETVIAYHSLVYCKFLYVLKKIRHFRLILEMEELYGDVTGDEKAKQWELCLAQQADAYIFPTQLLSRLINTQQKPEAIAHGTYRVEEDRKCNLFSNELQAKNSDIIHVVYAGTLDPRKGGALAAAAAAEFLPENYHVHILGFGSEMEIQEMQDLISDLSKKAVATITYDGLLSGEEYIRFLQSCDIGLSTQNPDAPFNATSFPSKILSYMANGLQVVSIRIPAIEQSAVADALYFYDVQTPEKIAEAILAVDRKAPCNSRQLIQNLDSIFCRKVEELLK